MGPGPQISGPGDDGGPSGPNGNPNFDPIPIGGEDQPSEIDWDKIFDPGPDSLLPDPAD